MKIHLGLTLSLALELMLLLAVLGPGGGAVAEGACDRWVVTAGSNVGDCSDSAHPCKTVQYAIDQAADGDLICVASLTTLLDPTVYHEHLLIARTLTLDGKWEATCAAPPGGCTFSSVRCTPERVVLDGFKQGRVITIDGTIKPTVDCFTITGGDAAGLGGDPGGRVDNDAGGGIYSRDAAPIIVNNVITANFGCDVCPASYGRGGGVYILNAPATAKISGNTIAMNVADNSTWGEGGGVMLRDSDAQVSYNLIASNRAGLSAGDGGGIAVKGGTPTITGNSIEGNVAGQAVMGLGGGIYVWSSTTAIIEGNTLIKNLAMQGAGDPTLKSLGGGIYYGGNPTVVAVIRDNRFLGNVATTLSPSGRGGGIYLQGLVAPSLVSGNYLEGNLAGHNCNGEGGGMAVDNSEVTIQGNDLVDNSATWAGDVGMGGGLFVAGGAAVVQANTFTANFGGGFPGAPSTATGYGGGIAVSESLTIVQANTLEDNVATNANAPGVGGGIYGYGGTVRLLRNTITGNQATPVAVGYGGGVYLQSMAPTLDANIILDNVAAGGATGRGGGVRIATCAPFTLTNNIIAGNQASQYGSGVAISAGSAGTLAHNTIADNQLGDGTGVYVNATGNVALLSNIIAGHTTGIADNGTGSVLADYTLFEANTTDHGAGVVSTNEVAGPAALLADYHIATGSGAIDHAPDLPWLTWDVDGDTRPLGPAWDVGADEYGSQIYLPLVLRNAHLGRIGEPR
jgi:parallel beta-helix repeat protein